MNPVRLPRRRNSDRVRDIVFRSGFTIAVALVAILVDRVLH